MSQVSAIFRSCVQAINNGELIEREGRSDKEFHFQNWFVKRLEALGLYFDCNCLGRGESGRVGAWN